MGVYVYVRVGVFVGCMHAHGGVCMKRVSVCVCACMRGGRSV